MVGQADRLGMATLTRLAEVMHTGLVDMRGTTSPRLVLELLCARMLLPGASTGDAALLQRLERMERRMDIAGNPVDAPISAAPSRAAVAEPKPVAPPRESGQPSSGPERQAPARTAGGERDGRRPAAVAEQPRTQPASDRRPPERPAAVRRGPDLGLPVPPTLSSQRPPAAAAPSAGSATSAQSRPAASARPEPPATTQSRPASEQPEATSAPAAEADKPSAAESPTAASTIGVTDVRRVWPEVLDRGATAAPDHPDPA